MKRFRNPMARTFAACAILVVLLAGCNKKKPIESVTAKELSGSARVVFGLIESEDLILDLTPRLAKFAKWFEANSGSKSNELLDELKTCDHMQGLIYSDSLPRFEPFADAPDFVEIASFAPTVQSTGPGDPWEAVYGIGATWETTKFGVLSGKFSENGSEFTLHTKAESRGRTDSHVCGLKAIQDLVFAKNGDEWKLVKWIQGEFIVERTAQPLFTEVLSEVLLDSESLANAQRSFKDEIIVSSSRKGGRITLPVPEVSNWESLTSNHIFPAVSVVDYNNDGLDDLFLTSRWGPTQMLEQQSDGTYVDVAKQIGLYEEFMVNCILFFDADNDGDKDALMGRPMEPAKYFRNDDGQYKNITKTHSNIGKQYFVCGISATDVNRDGLIDIYLSNYPPVNQMNLQFANTFLGAEERRWFEEKRKTENRWLDLPGSANVLLMNRGGGKLERVPFDDLISQWRCSYQAVWADIDSDGDDDLYVCNDFAPDALLRNDTPQGAEQPTFVEIGNEAIRNDDFGFGMGASFGDFDSDGDLDLYVSNMFSKAGQRIAEKVGVVDDRIKAAAAGSFLYVNTKGTFDQKAGPDSDDYHVNKIGWSYGGQFADFNNDGQLDLYVPTGYYTAPEEIATEVDT